MKHATKTERKFSNQVKRYICSKNQITTGVEAPWLSDEMATSPYFGAEGVDGEAEDLHWGIVVNAVKDRDMVEAYIPGYSKFVSVYKWKPGRVVPDLDPIIAAALAGEGEVVEVSSSSSAVDTSDMGISSADSEGANEWSPPYEPTPGPTGVVLSSKRAAPDDGGPAAKRAAPSGYERDEPLAKPKSQLPPDAPGGMGDKATRAQRKRKSFEGFELWDQRCAEDEPCLLYTSPSPRD